MSVTVAKETKFYDGRSSKTHTVSVVLHGSTLQISDENRSTLASWSLNSIKVVDMPEGHLPATITSTTMPEARLQLAEDKGWKYIKSRLPRSAFKRSVPIHIGTLLGYGGMSVGAIIAIFYLFPSVIGSLAYFVPLSWQKTLGQHAVTSIVGDSKTCVAPDGVQALDKIASKLKTQMKRDIDYKIFVIDNSWMPNAFAAPGGYVIIYKKVIADAGSPEEVAGVLAHEMSHVDLRHATKSIIVDMGLSFFLTLMIGDSGSFSDIAKFFSQMSYSRHDETEADMNAKQIMERVNIDPRGLQAFLMRIHDMEKTVDEFLKLDEIKGSEYLEYFSTHPNTDKRIKALVVDNNNTYPAVLNDREWQNLKTICKKTRATKVK